MSGPFYRLLRTLHLYIGLLISPFLILYALSALFLNHDWVPWEDGRVETVSHTMEMPQEENSRDLAFLIAGELGLAGDLGFVNLNRESGRLTFPLDRPGEEIRVTANLYSGDVDVEVRNRGVWRAMIFLHEMPGSHLVAIRGNWIYIVFWGWRADATAYMIFFLTATGIWMWAVLKAERKGGLLFLGVGTLFFVSVVTLMLQ